MGALECYKENGFLTTEDTTVCAVTCASETIRKEVVDGGTINKCVAREACAAWVREYLTVADKRKMYALCVESCPVGLPVFTEDSHECQACREATGW